MSAENIPRASIQPARYGGIDTELKNLKLLARRLQPILTIHSTELQIFQRLCYKNKNQHRGALFWRNVIEVRRFLERIESLNLCDSINAFRSKFYDTTQSVNSIKGPWTHCPDTNYLADYSEKCRKALRLVEKTAERCLNAHRSFHRSITRTLALELHEIIEQIRACTIRLSGIVGSILIITLHVDRRLF
ncbi:hypothetical protein GALMADRAFT_239595 [Galerina marginata CBS 339.88]|uniref:Nucleolus and neural progenitor protein-like N-terminal domain-containing protein n=1 Tax=Galerina marginata (strain CBS 339.88) TaxID=685588 RepID=A0A067TNT3_GALM3|nr:hypothetical protein GALMADRAFT_239595 [Galerina marginata CBS 339.88]